MLPLNPKPNATFNCFKPSGKWYAEGRGFVPDFFTKDHAFSNQEKLIRVLRANDNKWPGLSGPGNDFVRVVFLDEEVDYGWPLFFPDGVPW